ncbi:MAG: MerR family transcriptional regulator [Ktedonobacteraceae bacterium]|nr:MerR family transcriptional regulator [Ktedonobacteraceae bacterium]
MFRIGDFSKIAQVSGRLLRYYDEIGLLSPEFTDPQTGYRYYSAQQLPRLNRILALKELGISLEQIARLLDQDTSIEEMRGMLTLRKAQIEQSVQEEMARLRVVESRLEQIDTHGNVQEPDVILKSVPAQQFLALREVLPGMNAIRRVVQRISNVVPVVLGQDSSGHIAIVIHSPVYDPESLDVEVGYLPTGKAPKSFKLSEEHVLIQRTLPAVETMATVVHAGRVSETHQGYGVLATWVEQNNWQIAGLGREILMQLPSPDKEDDAVIELQLPVSRSNGKLGLDFDVTSNRTLEL